MLEQYAKYLTEEQIRKALTREVIADQRRQVTAIRDNVEAKRVALEQKKQQVYQRLESLQSKIIVFKEIWKIV